MQIDIGEGSVYLAIVPLWDHSKSVRAFRLSGDCNYSADG